MTDPISDIRDSEAGGLAASDLPLEDLGLSGRVASILRDAGLTTVGEVQSALEMGDGALTELKGIGSRSLEQIKEGLAALSLGSDGDGESQYAVDETQPMFEVADAAPADVELVEAQPAEKVPDILNAIPVEAAPTEKTPTEKMPAMVAPAATEAKVAERGPSLFERLRETVVQAAPRLGVPIVGGVGVVLILVALFLPPLSLLDRLGIVGYERLDAANPAVSHPDGVMLSVDPATFQGKLRLRVNAVPRLELLEGSTGAALREAVEQLPAHLAVKSPMYQIRTRGKASDSVMIDLVVPNDAEPWQTLDVYTWDGEAWSWLGSELHTEVGDEEFIRATVDRIPANVVVVQAGPVASTVSAYIESGDRPASTVGTDMLDEVHPVGLLLGTLGGFAGNVDELPQPDIPSVIIPTLRNWAPGATVNRGLLSDLLTMPKVQEDHIVNIVQLCAERGYAGVEVDYRGVLPDERDAYTAFVEALATALHDNDLKFIVVPEPPTRTDSGIVPNGYDWPALGALADIVKVRCPEDPAAYVQGGEAQRLLDWATGQVPRHKLHMLVSSLSVDRSGEDLAYVSLQDALAPFGEAVALQDVENVEPGNQLQFGLSGAVLSITPLETGGTYRLEYEADGGRAHTVWLGTAANLATKLEWAANYHLGGVTVANLLDPGNMEGVHDAIAAYRAAGSLPGEQLAVLWTVDSDGMTVDQQTSALTDPGYSWMVLATEGTYNVKASIAGFDHGAVAVTVGKPEERFVVATSEVTSTVEITSAVEVTATEEISICLSATYAADVTIPDDTQLENDEEFEKTWRVRNNGECAWPEDTVIAFVSGDKMDAPDTVEVGNVEPGEQVEISVKMKAPAEPGRYTGTWRMSTGGKPFGGSLTVVIKAGEAAPETAVIAPVSGGSFELGGHILNGGYPYASQMHYAGMNWSKVQVRYDPANNAAGLIQAAHANGLKIQLSALGAPNLVTQAGFEENFARWVASMAAAGADAIEIWNEPNIEREWQVGSISPQAYTRLLCASYSAIKAANPGTAVISAAPAPTGWFGGACTGNGCDDLPWLAGLAAAGAVNCMDYVGAHHNAGATSPSARTGHPADDGNHHHSWYFLPQTESYYNVFGGARKLFYTEMGYASQEGVSTFHDAFAWARGTDNAEQARWLAEAVSLSVNTGMVRCIIVWNIDFVRAGYDPQDGYAIIRPGGACPACDSLHAVLGSR